MRDRPTGLEREPYTALNQLLGILPGSWHLGRLSSPEDRSSSFRGLRETQASSFVGDGGRVLWASGQELEGGFGFGVVRQLFERAVRRMPRDDRGGLIGGAAALAGVVVGQDSPGAGRGWFPDSPFPVVHGLYWLTA